jgi:type I restriction enzyme, S subunit
MMSELPTSWTWSTIGDLSQYIQRGKSPKYADKSELPVINQKCIRWNELQVQHLKFIHPDQYSDWDLARYIAPGDILWNSTGTGTVGRAYQVKDVDCVPPKVVDSHVTIVRHIPEVDARYLFNWIKGPLVQGKIEEMCDGTTNQIELSRAAIAATAIPVAPAAEQTRIANQLDTLFTRIQACNDRFDAIPALLKRFRQTVLDAATFGTLTENWRESNGGNFEWKEVQLRDIADVKGGVTKDSKKQSVLDEEVPYLRVANVQRGYINFTEVKTIRVPSAKLQGLLLAEGDVLFNEGGDLDKLGRGWVWEGQIARCSFQNHVFRARLFDKRNQPKFLSWWGNSRGLEYFLRSGKQTTNLASINKTVLAALPIRLPSAPEQAEIVRRVEALFALADRIEACCTVARAKAQRLTPLVLAKAFRGELVAQDPQDEPASVMLQRIVATQPAKVQILRGRPRAASTNDTQPSLMVTQANWAALQDAVWEAPADPVGHASVVLLVAVLKAWVGPMPQMHARLATMLCLQPRLFTAVLLPDEAAQWCRLVGATATPLPAQVASFQSSTNSQWLRAISGMRARGDLIESGSGPKATWALGPGAAQIETAGWPDGRAGRAVSYLQTHGVESILLVIEPAAREFVNAKAA